MEEQGGATGALFAEALQIPGARSPWAPHINILAVVFCVSWCAKFEFRGCAGHVMEQTILQSAGP